MKTKVIIKSICFSLSIAFFACDDDVTPTLYENLPNAAAPIVSSVFPADTVMAGVTEVTITGQNFSPEASKNIVYFNEYVAEILESSSTELIVRTPNFVKDSVVIKISAQESPLFSDDYIIDVKRSIWEIYPFQDFEIPYAISTDKENNIILSYTSSGISTGITKITKDNTIIPFSPKGGESFYTDLRLGANGKIYGTRKAPVRAMFGSEEGTAPKAIAVADRDARLLSFDIDENNNIWVGGVNGNIYRVTPDESDKKPFPFIPEIQSIRIFNGDLYALASSDSLQSIWKMRIINSDSLGSAEEYFNVSDNSEYEVNTITFSNDGKLFMGTSAVGVNPNAIMYLTPEKELLQWYPNVISGPVISFAWNTGDVLYYTREGSDNSNQLVMGVNMDMKGAPYFGRD